MNAIVLFITTTRISLIVVIFRRSNGGSSSNIREGGAGRISGGILFLMSLSH